MKLREKLSNRESSGAVTLIFVILSIQTGLFLFNNSDKPQAVIESRGESTAPYTMGYENSEIVSSDVGKNRQKVRPKINSQTRPHITQQANSQTNSQTNLQTNLQSTSQKRATPQYELFQFDPNIATMEEFVRLGLSEGQAKVILRYRERGGVFREREDFKKIYVLSEGFYERVEKYIVISSLDEIYDNPPANSAVRKVTDINRADSAELIALPGIGPYYASRILSFRERVGGYLNTEQLLDIPGMDSARFSLFCNYITVDTTLVSKRDISALSVEELSHNPYIGSYKARAIMRLRDISNDGRIKLSDLIINNIINQELSKILKQYFH